MQRSRRRMSHRENGNAHGLRHQLVGEAVASLRCCANFVNGFHVGVFILPNPKLNKASQCWMGAMLAGLD
eukprot:3437212-Amphidinium_carterae.1